jgi:murein L,D-transpeptidase YafK
MKNPLRLLLAALAALWLNLRVQADDDFQALDAPARLALARTRHEASARQLCTQAGLAYPPRMIFLRAFKRPAELELWATDRGKPMRLLKTYAVAGLERCGAPGPKRRQGDLQVPEGCYRIAVFNPQSRFHLSLGLDYPNAADRIHADREKPGGEIYIHGSNVSIGCLPIGDPAIEELYILVSDTHAHGQREIPVHIFPSRMSGESWTTVQARHPGHAAFWSELQPIYDVFEKTKRVPIVEVAPTGHYVLK